MVKSLSVWSTKQRKYCSLQLSIKTHEMSKLNSFLLFFFNGNKLSNVQCYVQSLFSHCLHVRHCYHPFVHLIVTCEQCCGKKFAPCCVRCLPLPPTPTPTPTPMPLNHSPAQFQLSCAFIFLFVVVVVLS